MTNGFKILDNGAAENSLVTPRELLRSAHEMCVDEVVVPDVLGDCEGTINKARDFKRAARSSPEFSYMGVVQGRNTAELIKCFNAFMYMDYITTIALPRHVNKVDKLMRYNLAAVFPHRAEEEGRHFEFHCLGSSNWVREVVLLAELESIRGIDTSMPISFAIARHRMAQELAYVPRPQGYFDWTPPLVECATPEDTDTLQIVEGETGALIDDNIRTFLEWAASASGGSM